MVRCRVFGISGLTNRRLCQIPFQLSPYSSIASPTLELSPPFAGRSALSTVIVTKKCLILTSFPRKVTCLVTIVVWTKDKDDLRRHRLNRVGGPFLNGSLSPPLRRTTGTGPVPFGESFPTRTGTACAVFVPYGLCRLLLNGSLTSTVFLSSQDDWDQPRALWEKFSDEDKEQTLNNITGMLAPCQQFLQDRVVGLFGKIHEDMAAGLTKRLNAAKEGKAKTSQTA